jgi:signal transduction histidine kinase
MVGLVWALYSLAFAGLLLQNPGIDSFGIALLGSAVGNALLVLWMLPAWHVAFQRLHGASWGTLVAAHAVMGPLVTAAWFVSNAGVIALARGQSLGQMLGQMAAPGWVAYGTLMTYVIVFALLHGVQAVRRLRLREQQAAELVALARDRELAALKAQVRPHFLFNTLNSISATVKRDPDAAREMIAELAGLLRYALDASGGSDADGQVPLREEVAFTRRYLRLEQHRFSDRLEVDVAVHVPAATLERPVPPMLLQPLVENALRHGIAPCPEGGRVEVSLIAPPCGDGAPSDGAPRGDASAAEASAPGAPLVVRVADTGVGGDLPASVLAEPPAEGDETLPRPERGDEGGFGLAATNARLVRTFGPGARLHVEPNAPRGFVVWFELPGSGG